MIEKELTEEQIKTVLEYIRLSKAERQKAYNILLGRYEIKVNHNLELVINDA